MNIRKIRFSKSDKILIPIIFLLLATMTYTAMQLRTTNKELSAAKLKISEVEKREEFTDNASDLTNAMEQEYRSRLIDLQKFIGTPEKIKYELPYDTNDCTDKFPGLQKCVYMDRSYYENNTCLIYNKVKVTDNGTEPATPKDKKAYDDCRAKYQQLFEAWNPDN